MLWLLGLLKAQVVDVRHPIVSIEELDAVLAGLQGKGDVVFLEIIPAVGLGGDGANGLAIQHNRERTALLGGCAEVCHISATLWNIDIFPFDGVALAVA